MYLIVHKDCDGNLHLSCTADLTPHIGFLHRHIKEDGFVCITFVSELDYPGTVSAADRESGK